MKNRWLRRSVSAVLFVGLIAVSLAAVALWLGNRDVPPTTEAQREQAFRRAVSWMRAHETELLRDSNMALWWFVQTAAERTNNPDLRALLLRHRAVATQDGINRLPWWHMMDPNADTLRHIVPLDALEPYQRFLYHAVTCEPVALAEGDTRAFLAPALCRPMLTQVILDDPACTTHQLAGVMLMARMACAPQHTLPPLARALLQDIEHQMQWDVVVKDAYFQRVMMLMWQGRPEQLKAVWLHRVYQAQQPDGGWAGGRQFPELPQWVQPWALRAHLAKWWPSRFHVNAGTDFHASAQGLLITALALQERR